MDLVEESVDLADGRPPVRLLRPRSSDVLIDEGRFADEDEFLPYWAELWPSAIVLSRRLAGPLEALAGLRVLELGCGLGLPALAATRAGAHVVATDWAAEAVGAAARNAAANDLSLRPVVADWRDTDTLTALGPFDLVLAADVLYEARNADPLLALLRALDPPRTLLADPSRPTAAPFLRTAATHWTLTTTTTTTTDDSRPAIHLHELRRR